MNNSPDGRASFLRAFTKNSLGFTNFIVNRLTRTAAVVALAIAASSVTSYAQSNAQGGLFGRVLGATAAELTGAKATIVSKDSGVARSAAVSSSGTFEVSNLPVGDYSVSVALTGREAVAQPAFVGINTTNTVRFDLASGDVYKMDKFVVSGESQSPVNVATAEIGLNIRMETIEQLPVARNLTAVAMLTPGATMGDTGFFGNLVSFSGSGVAENAYYLNGFNITDFRTGLGYGTVPFQFFQDFQVKTTGYSAEFGRSIGGVVNAVSKRGSNEYHATVSYFWEPKGLNENGFDSYRSNGALYLVRTIGSVDTKNYNVTFSGPIWKNHLYFYGMYQGRDVKDDFMNGTTQWHFRTQKDPFWAGKVDWQINDKNSIEYTTFSDSRQSTTQRYGYVLTSANNAFTRPAALGANAGNVYNNGGGRTQTARYIGNFFDDTLNLSLLWGKSTKDTAQTSDAAGQIYVLDTRTTSAVLSGVAALTEDLDTRNAYRFDGSYKYSLMGSHTLKFGYDLENNKTHNLQKPSGPGITSYTYYAYTAGGVLANGATAPAGTTQVVGAIQFAHGGDYRVVTEASYLEDNWKLMQDRLSLTYGVRREMFDDKNGNDKTFIKLKDMYAPRLSFAYDVTGDSLSKVYGSWGRYYLQIPTNTAVRQAAGETFKTDYYVLNSVNPDFTPVLGAKIGNQVVTGTGVVPGAETIVNANIKPMYQDEFVIGYEKALNKKWSASITGIYRNLGQTTEDSAVDAAVLKYAKSKGYNTFEVGGFDYYVLTNPGSDLTFWINMKNDQNHDGVVDYADQEGGKDAKEKVTLAAADLGYPKATRKYYGVETRLDRKFADKWFASFSYVWSHTYGNYEGTVYSDIGQADAGITQLFDQPGLVDGTYGPTANDRRHTFKAYGGYQLTKELFLSGNFVAQSGRPRNGLGLHPTDAYARAYGAASEYIGGKLSPRGSLGRLNWTFQTDLGLKYKPKWGRDKLSFSVDVFNIENAQTITAIREQAETAAGASEPRFNKARTIQTPRYFRFSAQLDY